MIVTGEDVVDGPNRIIIRDCLLTPIVSGASSCSVPPAFQGRVIALKPGNEFGGLKTGPFGILAFNLPGSTLETVSTATGGPLLVGRAAP